MSTEVFEVNNVKCGGCVSAIQTALGKLQGVENVEVDIPTGQVTVTGAADRDDIRKTLQETGYPENHEQP